MDLIEIIEPVSEIVINDSGDAVVIETLSGVQGLPGPQGDSAYDEAVRNGFTGTEQEWLDSLVTGLSIGTVDTLSPDSPATATITGSAPSQVLNLGLVKGDRGSAATINVGTVTTGAAGSGVIITNSGTTADAVIDFTIPKGDKGDKGDTGATGPVNTLTVGTVGAVDYGTAPSVTITGTSPNQIINFVLESGPQGPKGDKGDQGVPGTGNVDSVNGKLGPNIVLTADDIAGTATRLWVPGGGTNGQFLKNVNGVLTWAADNDTTYAIPSQAEAQAGTATTARAFSAQRVSQAIAALSPVKSVAGRTGAISLTKTDVGLANVDNTSDANKPVSTATQTALDAKADVIEGVIVEESLPQRLSRSGKSITDWNEVRENGFFAGSAVAANAPVDGEKYFVKVNANDINYVVQEATSPTVESLYGYGGTTPAVNYASPPLIDLDYLGAQGYVSLDGLGGSNVTSQGNPPNGTTGSLDISMLLELESWMDPLAGGLLNKQDSWRIIVNPSRDSILLGMWFSGALTTFTSADPGILPWERTWIRATYDSVTGIVNFFKGTDGVNWTSISNSNYTGGGAFDASSSYVEIGSRDLGISDSSATRGNFFRTQVRDGIDGELLYDFNADDFEDKASDTDSAVDSVGNTWTLNGAGTKIHTRKTLWLPGVAGNYVSTPDKNLLDFDSSTFENGIGKWEGLNKNLLTANQSSFETDTSGWQGWSQCAVTRSTAASLDGSASLTITATANGDAMAATNPRTPVIPGQIYTAIASFKSASTSRKIGMNLNWYDAGGTEIGNIGYSDWDVDNSVGWTQTIRTAQAPQNAATVQIRLLVDEPVAGEIHYVDRISLMETPNANLVSNPDFENGATGWLDNQSAGVVRDSSEAYSGTASGKFVAANSGHAAYITVPTIAGNTYTFSAYVKGTDPAFQINARSDTATVIGNGGFVALSSSWQRASVTFTATDADTFLWLRASQAGTIYIDGVQAVKGSAALPYLPPKTTNLILDPSGTTGNSISSRWFGDGSTGVVSYSASAAYVGTTGVRKTWTTVGASLDTGFSIKSAVGVIVPGRTYTFSVYMRSSRPQPFTNWIEWRDAGGNKIPYTGDSKNGQLSIYDSTANPANTWVRVQRTGVAPAGAVAGDLISTVYNGPISSWQPGDTLDADAAQLEYGSVATPYVDGSLGAGYEWDSSNNLLPTTASSFESTTDFGGWVNNYNGTTMTSDSSQKYAGARSLRVVPGMENWGYYGSGTVEGMASRGIVPGNFYSISAWVYSDTAQTLMICDYANSSVGYGPGVAVPANTWTRLTHTYFLPSTATAFYLSIRNPDRVTIPGAFYMDAVQVEQSSFATPYGQTGAANASTSTRSTAWTLGGAAFENMTRTTSASAAHGSTFLQVGRSVRQIDSRPYGVGYVADVSPNTTYTLSAYTQGAPVWFRVIDRITGVQLAVFETSTATLKDNRESVSFTTGASTTSVHLRVEWTYPVNYTTGTNDFFFDSVQLEKSATATAYVPPIRITGDIDIRVKASLSDWSVTGNGFIGKRGGALGEYALRTSATAGHLELFWLESGVGKGATSTAAIPFTNNQVGWIRATRKNDNGTGKYEITFYTSLDGVTWTTLGTPVMGTAVAAPGLSDSSLRVGDVDGQFLPRSNVMFAQVRAGIDGPIAAEFRPEESTAPGTSWSDSTGRVWTVNRGTVSTGEIVDRNTWAFTGTGVGTGERLMFPDRPELELLPGANLTVASSFLFRNTTGRCYVLSDWETSPNSVNIGWDFFVESGNMNMRTLSTGGDYNAQGQPIVSGSWHVASGERVDDYLRAYVDGTGSSTLLDANADMDTRNGRGVSIGHSGIPDYGQEFLNQPVLQPWAVIFRRGLTSAEHAELAAWNGRIKTEPVWLRDAATLYVNADDPYTREVYRTYNEVYNLADGFTGDSQDASWTGTPHKSTALRSTRKYIRTYRNGVWYPWSPVDKETIGLSNVDNTSDLDKPISTATQDALDDKAALVHQHSADDITSGTLALSRLPVAASGVSNTTQLVRADDTRLLSNVTRVIYDTGTSSYPARPTGATYVEWVGPVQPTNPVNGDTWVNTA